MQTVNPKQREPADAATVLREFVNDIRYVVEHADGSVAPASAPGWLNLGVTYLRACEALQITADVRPSGYANADEADRTERDGWNSL